MATERASRIARNGAGVVILLIVVGGLWMAFAPMHGAVIIPATVMVQNYRKTVQHLEGGIVSEILVKQGDFVEEGQALLRLHDVQAKAAVELLQDQIDGEIARSSRLEAERTLLESVRFPSDLALRAKERPKLNTLLEGERTLFSARWRHLQGQIEILRAQISQIEEEILGLRQQLASADAGETYLAEELKINEELLDKKFVQRTRVMAFQRALAEKNEKRGEYVAEIAKARQKISESNLRIIGLKDAYVRDASNELKDSRQKLLELKERIRPSEDALTRQIVVAPVAGEVVDLRVNTVGGVVAPRETLMDILPSESILVVEGKIKTEDIAYASVDAPVNVQLSAFKQGVTPMIRGKVTYISSDTLSETIGGHSIYYYRLQTVLDRESLRSAGIGKLAPGMPAVVYLQTRARTALEYLIEPVIDRLRRSLREY